ncbi:conserved hypothetical protein [Arthrobacter sp. Hiyo1]|uniref:hypothetical protein n=1 Tax=Arthrobacter sp. Hiyo1 TaxID=1588020 RepID=UPI0006A3C50B|nr:hypothetical protein [Arthrobacter sp. Hiyo1]GAP59755.1 conserved hypothetical protein [Arthrobacter sp. Hiyo1]
MPPDQFVGLAVNVVVYLALIAFVLYRQMMAQPLRVRPLVLLLAVLGLFGLQQLARQSLAADRGRVVLLVVGLVIGLGAGLWRGTTFRVWPDAGRVMVKGTAMTLVTWAVLIVIRLPFAFLGYAANHSQGFVVGELLLALAVTFAAQNAVIWARAKGLNVDETIVRPSNRKW